MSIQSPRSPTRYMRNSLALNFTESPPGQPMFDLSRSRRSMSSSVIVQHSSPVTVPSSSRQETPYSVSVGPSVLPAGTVPTTPGPFQKALEQDTASKTPSPVFSPMLELDSTNELIPTPMPGTNLAFEDIHPDIVLGPSSVKSPKEHPGYFDILVEDIREKLIDFDDSQYHCEAARRASAEALKDLIYNLKPTTSEAPDAEKLHTLRRKPTFNCQKTDRIGLELSVEGSANDGPTEEAPMDGIEHIVWEEENAPAVTATPDMKYTLTTDELPTGHSTEDNEAESDDRLQAWHTHPGLYDGSGYGGETESTISRPSTSTYETTETAPTTEDAVSVAEAKRKDNLVSATVGNREATPSHASSDHETLEEVIRAYAVYEEEVATCTSDSDIEEDLELARKIGA
ncbi:hypothetical protein T440DRAFT_40474 [Plenodomus tracheiphilus IPT5]|uniref:Uncharacterized protein n=1 Tax=Plenodomus tracheiphilus IPT5 TaxID=1408161 RepID=A0A6A7B9X4_9PLEO|nr:hypothetical protein T440DRAFT_40474 [Plenodomus tracheiphilus IPT5]